ncbi:MAG: DUF1786 family protein [Desulfobacterales bacterium]
MSRILCLDVGAGTLDILWVDTEREPPLKAVVASPVRTIAERAERLPGDLLVTGGEMGGGPVTEVLRRRAASHRVRITREAAATLHHDPQVVHGWGLEVIDAAEAESLRRGRSVSHLVLADIEVERIRRIVEGFGVPFAFDFVALCLQDHGVPPAGASHLDFRHRLYRAPLEAGRPLHELLWRPGEVPTALNRLRTAVEDARRIPAEQVYAMDSGLAAVAGAALDPRAPLDRPFLVLDIATSHTVCAAREREELCALVEIHTRDLAPARLEELIRRTAAGDLDHDGVVAQGGHGAYLRRAAGEAALGCILATGPKRRLAAGIRFPVLWGAPFGDNLMTGCAGLLDCLCRREGLPPIRIL